MAVRVLPRIVSNFEESQSTAGRPSQTNVTLVSGTAAPSIEQALNSTAPMFFGPRFMMHVGAIKAPVITAVSTSTRRRSERSRRRVKRRSDVELIAFSVPVDRDDGAGNFAFQLLSTSVVPTEFPMESPRSQSVYSRRDG